MFDGDKVRRLGSHDMRKDGEWLQLLSPPKIKVGEHMVLILQPLSEDATFTRRETTTVLEVYEDE
jgi:hypothetical protein